MRSVQEAAARPDLTPDRRAAPIPQPGTGIFVTLALALALSLTTLHSYLIFHSLVELFTVAVGWSTFFLAWNARRYLDNHYLLLVGIAALFTGGIDVLHLVSYKGMHILPHEGADTATQFWIAGRLLFSIALVAAPLFVRRKVSSALAFAVLGGAAALVTAAIFADVFPVCYVEGAGLTAFKTVSEYAIILLLAAAGVLLYRVRANFDTAVWTQLLTSIALMAAAELAFTEYVDVYGGANLAGHLLRFVAICVLYRAIIVTGLVRPFTLLFRNLAQSEEALRVSDERYREFVVKTSDAIVRYELDEPVPASLPEKQQVERLLRDARVAECNDVYARIRGASSAAEIIGACPAMVEMLRVFVRSGYRMPAPEVCEVSIRGERRWISGHFTGIVEDGCLVRAWGVLRDVTEFRLATMERERLIGELQQALADVKTLSGLLPICANCKKIRDDGGYWTQVESYISKRTDVAFSHGICPDCMTSLYPEYFPERPE